MKQEVIKFIEDNFSSLYATVKENDIVISLKDKSILYCSRYSFDIISLVEEMNKKDFCLVNKHSKKILSKIKLAEYENSTNKEGLLFNKNLAIFKNIEKVDNVQKFIKEQENCKGEFNGSRCCEGVVTEILEEIGDKTYFDKQADCFVNLEDKMFENDVYYAVNLYNLFKAYKVKKIKKQIKSLENTLEQFK